MPHDGTGRFRHYVGYTLCIRLSGKCTTGVIQYLPAVATEKLSVKQAKLDFLGGELAVLQI